MIILTYMVFKQNKKKMQSASLVKEKISVIFAVLLHPCFACLFIDDRKAVQSFQKNLWESFRILTCKPRLYKFMDKSVLLENHLESYSL